MNNFYRFGAIPSSHSRGSGSAIPDGQQYYTTAGTFSWTAPEDVTLVSVACIGGGGGGCCLYYDAAGGGSGGLGYKNDIAVIPGNTYTVVVGAGGFGYKYNSSSACPDKYAGTGGSSYFIDSTTVQGAGGGRSWIDYNDTKPGNGGSYTGDGGTTGNRGGDTSSEYVTVYGGAALNMPGGTSEGNGGGARSGMSTNYASSGSVGAVRLIWGSDRAYPATNVADL